LARSMPRRASRIRLTPHSPLPLRYTGPWT
jgi:hypothetical protein